MQLHAENVPDQAAFADLLRRVAGGDPAVLQNHDTVRAAERQRQVVHDSDDALSSGHQSPQGLHQLQLPRDVQIGGRLVQQDMPGVLGQGHGDIGFLPEAAGKRRQRPVCQIRDPHLPQRVLRNLPVHFAVPPGVFQVGESAVEHHLLHRHTGHALALGEIGDLFRNIPAGQARCRRLIQQNLPGSQGQDAHRRLQQGTFSRAVGADDGGQLALRQVERDVFQHVFPAVTGTDVFQFNHHCALPCLLSG